MIVQEYYPKDIRVKKEARALIERGHRVSILALHGTGERKQEIIDGARVYRIGLSKKRAGILRYTLEYMVFWIHAALKLNLLDRRERFDVIHVNTLPDFLVFVAAIQKWKRRRIILDMHEIMPEFFMSKFNVGTGHPIVRILRVLERASLRFADDVITVSDTIKQVFQKRAIPNKSITVVMNTVSTSTIHVAAKRPHTMFNCVYHGTLTDMYGLDVAIRGFAMISRKYSDMVFHIFGEGPNLDLLKELVDKLHLGESVVFHGFVPHEKVMQDLTEMDLGILAIRKDVFLNLSFSNKLAEYVFLKIPTISSDLDTVRHYFGEDSLLYFAAGDSDDLATKIEFAYLNREAMEVKAKNAYVAAQPLDWDLMAEKYISVVEQGQ